MISCTATTKSHLLPLPFQRSLSVASTCRNKVWLSQHFKPLNMLPSEQRGMWERGTARQVAEHAALPAQMVPEAILLLCSQPIVQHLPLLQPAAESLPPQLVAMMLHCGMLLSPAVPAVMHEGLPSLPALPQQVMLEHHLSMPLHQAQELCCHLTDACFFTCPRWHTFGLWTPLLQSAAGLHSQEAAHVMCDMSLPQASRPSAIFEHAMQVIFALCSMHGIPLCPRNKGEAKSSRQHVAKVHMLLKVTD